MAPSKIPSYGRNVVTSTTLPTGVGGTEEERNQADLAFKECVVKKTGNTELAEIMYQTVRVGGSPHFPTWYRWGYGWPAGRGYKNCPEQELLLVDQKLAVYKNYKD